MSLKIQCPACRSLVELRDFYTSEAGLFFRCVRCEQESLVKNPRAQDGGGLHVAAPPAQHLFDAANGESDAAVLSGTAAITAAPQSIEVICPKCGHGQVDPVACHRCGLMFANYDPNALPPDPEVAVTAWTEVQRNPLSEDAHEAFIKACLAVNRLDFGARQYRLLARDPGKRAQAEKMLARLSRVGQARLGAPAISSGQDHKEQPSSRAKAVRWIFFLVAAGLFSYFIMKLTDLLNML